MAYFKAASMSWLIIIIVIIDKIDIYTYVVNEDDFKDKKDKQDKPLVEDGACTKVEEEISSPTNLSMETKRRLVIADIMQQPLADYTPMRALIYLNSLQERIRNEGISE